MGNMMTSPPGGANRAPNFGPSCGGLRGLWFAYPHADKRRGVSQAMPAASWSRLLALDAACGR